MHSVSRRKLNQNLFTGDAAAIITSTNNVGQCCVGLKFLDEDVLDPEQPVCGYLHASRNLPSAREQRSY
jgi:hypothetical protein